MNPVSRDKIHTLLNFHAIKSSREKFNRLKLIRFLRIFFWKSQSFQAGRALKVYYHFIFKRTVHCLLRQKMTRQRSIKKLFYVIYLPFFFCIILTSAGKVTNILSILILP